MITIERAILIAVGAHSGQKDLEGRPEILHPLRVGLMGETREEVITGILHDVVEDSSLTIDDLRKEGVDEEILTALHLLTHDKKAQTYMDYVRAIAVSGNQLAIRVKLHDLTHNLERGRANGHESLVKKHERAYEIIRGAVR